MKAVLFRSEILIPDLWLNCIKTFPLNGFETIIYSTHPEIHKKYLPENIKCFNSNEILSTDLLYKLKQDSQKEHWHYKAFSDFFRATIMKKYPGSWYFDNDIICLKNISQFKEINNLSKGKIIVGRQSSEIINGAIFSVSDSKIIDHYIKLLYEFSENKNHIHEWGDTGPSFISWYSKNYPENVFIIDQPVFYPISPDQTNYLYDPKLKNLGLEKIKDSVCVHLWSECIEMTSIPLNMLPPKSSLFLELLNERTDINDKIILPEETALKLLYPSKIGLKKLMLNFLPALISFLRRKFEIIK